MKQLITVFVLGHVPHLPEDKGLQQTPSTRHPSPHHFIISLPRCFFIKEERRSLEGVTVSFLLKGFDPDILLIQASLELQTLFSPGTAHLTHELHAMCQTILKEHGGTQEFSEPYSIFSVSHYKGDPEQFLKVYGPTIAALLKSEFVELDQKEVDYTLQSCIKYAKHDLAIIDWDGAFLFDPLGSFDAAVELFILANLQLLRHRVLDRQLDERIELTAKLVREPGNSPAFFSNKALTRDLRDIIGNRMASISRLQVLEREIKLIGDWYLARLYELTAKKFRLDDWRASIRNKLQSLQEIYSIILENFSISTKHRAEWIQIIAFFVLQVGWFVLIILEFVYFTR